MIILFGRIDFNQKIYEKNLFRGQSVGLPYRIDPDGYGPDGRDDFTKKEVWNGGTIGNREN